MRKHKSILIVDDEVDIVESLARILEQREYFCYTATSGKAALEILKLYSIDIVLCDLVMPEMDGLDLLKKIKYIYPHIQVIILTAYGTIESSIESIKNGAYSYLLKPFNIEEIFLEIDKVGKVLELEEENREFKQKEADAYLLYTSKNPYMKSILSTISEKIAYPDTTILVTGESGTGKEVIASYIHKLSSRKKGPFIKVNCAALSEGLLESELFGHVKGSFTGAIRDKTGRFELANSGTIFLDEIGDFSANIQLKLLRVIQERTIERVGDNHSRKVNTRIIAATNCNLDDLVSEKKFREDLYYRINVVNIHLPPLRKRKEDISDLIKQFIRKYSHKNNIVISEFDSKAMEILHDYNWPGNIRELENVIERAVIFSENGYINIEHLPDKIKNIQNQKSLELDISLKQAREKFEKEYIIKALNNNQGNVSKTAKSLDIARKNLYEKIKKYHIVL